MKKVIIISALILMAITISYGQDDKSLVKTCFANYKNATRLEKGEEALKFVDSKTISYYDTIANLARSADSIKISSLPFLKKLTILSIRHRASKEEILKMNGKSFFTYYVDHGLVGKEQAVNNEVGEITIDGNFAKGQFIYKGRQTPLDFQFYKEQEQWKFNLTSMYAFTAMIAKKSIENMGLTEEEFIVMALEKSTGKKPENIIWKPLE